MNIDIKKKITFIAEGAASVLFKIEQRYINPGDEPLQEFQNIQDNTFFAHSSDHKKTGETLILKYRIPAHILYTCQGHFSESSVTQLITEICKKSPLLKIRKAKRALPPESFEYKAYLKYKRRSNIPQTKAFSAYEQYITKNKAWSLHARELMRTLPLEERQKGFSRPAGIVSFGENCFAIALVLLLRHGWSARCWLR